ncbi:hypothetical protein DY000_02011738 [Brassica cretica]|uniref:NADH:quinone oxidoreductase/Mrp antiporter membrane subunit domain-containing protein n=1 Tax=Brassica cretica TaxID=69181 RepID=A0ABQ7CRA2_BRACR|nr:hypothetical protein DY000_02011738 [Brassica cretica]
MLYTSKYREARRQLSIITTLVGKEYYDNSEQSYEGSYRRLKYVGYETESFLILTFLREVSNVLPIPWDPLIPCFIPVMLLMMTSHGLELSILTFLCGGYMLWRVLYGVFSSATRTKGIKISTLSFEIANTIVKGSNLMHSLSMIASHI